MEDADRQIFLDLMEPPRVAADLLNRIMSSPTGPMVQLLAQVLRKTVVDADLPDIAERAVQPAVRASAYRALLAGQAKWVVSSYWKWKDLRHGVGRQETTHESRPLSIAPPLLEFLNKAAEDRSTIVRGVASETLVREMRNPSIPVQALALAFSQDKSKAVAERGEFILREIGR